MPNHLALNSIDEFKPLLGEAFRVRVDERTELEARLDELRSLGFNTPVGRGGRESFSLLFHAPAGVRLPQRIYTFTHPRLGARDFFLVPLGPDSQGMRLEVIFNFA
ncbi:MAG TPA: hypothetical protein VGD81_14435 [Opitutaceae bacterium]